MSKEEKPPFPSFPYAGDALIKYLFTSGVFTILLKDGKIVHHEPEDVAAFESWLNSCNVLDMRDED